MVLTELLEKGGIVMPIILTLSVYVVAVIIYKIYQFCSTGVFANAFIDKILEAIDSKKISEAMNIANEHKGPIARVIEVTINTIGNRGISEEKRVRLIESAGIREIRIYENHMRGLEMVANISPLLGLLGTVTGMVKVFAGISQTGSGVDPALLAGGIWEALLTTVVGLAVAIPALAAHYILESRIDTIRAELKEAVMSVITRSGN
jgi:biopolymer transport protein ExbB